LLDTLGGYENRIWYQTIESSGKLLQYITTFITTLLTSFVFVTWQTVQTTSHEITKLNEQVKNLESSLSEKYSFQSSRFNSLEERVREIEFGKQAKRP